MSERERLDACKLEYVCVGVCISEAIFTGLDGPALEEQEAE